VISAADYNSSHFCLIDIREEDGIPQESAFESNHSR
jgi:hypothetical protein